METPELDRVFPGVCHLAFENDDAVYDTVDAVALAMLSDAGIHATCETGGDDELEILITVKGVTFSEAVDRSDPMPCIVGCVNAVLKAQGYPKRWNQFSEEHWRAGELGVVLVDAAQLEALHESDLIVEGVICDPSDPND
jgi:hypothetical protein